jgi:hypothetical protein
LVSGAECLGASSLSSLSRSLSAKLGIVTGKIYAMWAAAEIGAMVVVIGATRSA